MKLSFSDRLEKFRDELNISKIEMAKKLGISESYYSLLVNGKREVSKKLLYKLVLMSNKPEEYWVYGVEDNENIIQSREVCKCTLKAYELLKECNILSEDKIDSLFSFDGKVQLSSAETLLIKAMKADLKHLFEKDKLK